MVVLLCLAPWSVFAQSVTLTWNPSPDTNAVGYKIYYGGASGVYTNTVSVGSATTATISGLLAGVTYYFSATTVAASGAESPFSNEATYVPVAVTNSPIGTGSSPAGLPPTLNAIANLTISQNAGLQTVNLTGISAGTSGNVTVNVYAVSSDNGTIISAPIVNYTNSNSTGTVTFTPVAGATGTATVTVTVDNGGVSNNPTSQMFTVTVQPAAVAVNQGPTLNALPNLTIYQNSGIQTVPLTGIATGIGGAYQVVTIWVYSSDSTIIPTPTLNYTSPNSTGSLTFTPVAGALGTATVTVTVNNGASNFSRVFTVTVVPASAVVPQPPTLNPIANLTAYQNTGVQTVNLTGISAGTSGNPTVNVYAVSSDNGTIISTPVVNYTNSNSTATLTFTPVAGATGTATVTVTVDNGGASNNPTSQAFTVTVLPPPVIAPQPPTLDAITNLTIYQNSGLQTINLTGISAGTSGNPTVNVYAVSSDNGAIISTPTVNYTNSNSTGTLTFTPVATATGTATVTVTVDNGGTSNNPTSQVFTVTVMPPPVVSLPPTLNALPNVTIYQNAGSQTVALTGITSGSANQNQTLTISAASSNPAIVATPTVKYTYPNNSGTLTLSPLANAIGTSVVTVTVNNGGENNNSVAQTFTVTVLPAPAIVPLPTLNPIPNVTVLQSAVQSVTLTGISAGPTTGVQGHARGTSSQLRLTVSSSNPGLVAASVRYSSPSSTGVLTLRPSVTLTGTATITVTLNNGAPTNNITTQSFTVTVLPIVPPTLDPIANLTVVENAGLQSITLTGITAGTTVPNQTLRVTATSNNPHVVSHPQIRYTSPAETGVLTFSPSATSAGTATVTVTVSTGSRANQTFRQYFTVTVIPPGTNTVSAATVKPVSLAKPNTQAVQDTAATLTTVPAARGQFGFQLTGVPGAKYVVQASADLINWTSVQTNTAPFIFQDDTTGSAQRFYRAFYFQ